MAKATILTVDDDPAVSRAITRDLRRQYGAEYQIVSALSGALALTVLTEFAQRSRPVALIASDQRMPEMTGVEFLEQARPHAPEAKLVLLTAYADTDASRPSPECETGGSTKRSAEDVAPSEGRRASCEISPVWTTTEDSY